MCDVGVHIISESVQKLLRHLNEETVLFSEKVETLECLVLLVNAMTVPEQQQVIENVETIVVQLCAHPVLC